LARRQPERRERGLRTEAQRGHIHHTGTLKFDINRIPIHCFSYYYSLDSSPDFAVQIIDSEFHIVEAQFLIGDVAHLPTPGRILDD
jgi:hypothetical protein